MPQAAATTVDTAAILREGAYYVLDDYAMREEMYAKVKRAFFDGIEKLSGADTRRKVEAAGLSRMHEHFPVTKLLLLEDYLLRTLQRDLFYWSFRVGREDLGLEGTFYVDHLIVMRIHYPFLIAREAKHVEKPKYRIWEKSRLAFAALKNVRLIANEISKAREQRKQKSGYDSDAYHRRLPEVARAHGAHIDTWYGHSYDGVNLWWSIDGVNPDNTMILYPGMFGYTYPFDPANMYLAEGVPVTRPHKIVPKPGQLLVFNPETLHGTQVNISNETRVVISTRLNPGQPRFDLSAAWNFEYLVLLRRSRAPQVLRGDRLSRQGQPRQAVIRVQARSAGHRAPADSDPGAPGPRRSEGVCVGRPPERREDRRQLREREGDALPSERLRARARTDLPAPWLRHAGRPSRRPEYLLSRTRRRLLARGRDVPLQGVHAAAVPGLRERRRDPPPPGLIGYLIRTDPSCAV